MLPRHLPSPPAPRRRFRFWNDKSINSSVETSVDKEALGATCVSVFTVSVEKYVGCVHGGSSTFHPMEQGFSRACLRGLPLRRTEKCPRAVSGCCGTSVSFLTHLTHRGPSSSTVSRWLQEDTPLGGFPTGSFDPVSGLLFGLIFCLSVSPWALFRRVPVSHSRPAVQHRNLIV